MLKTTSFHDNFKNILPLAHDNLKLIATINLFYAHHVFLSLGYNKSNDLAMFPIGLAWFFRHLVQNFGWVFYLCFSFVLVQVHHHLAMKIMQKNILGICVELEEPNYVILKWNV